MIDDEMVTELAKRAGVSEADAKAVLTAVTELAREQRRLARTTDAPTSYVPTDREISDLIAAAGNHPLGLQFLLEGDLSAVAAMFGTHAFTVDAARTRIREQGANLA